jgi:hypothetical protein
VCGAKTRNRVWPGGSLVGLGGSSILVDQSAKDAMASDQRVAGDHSGWIVSRRVLVDPLVRPVAVEVARPAGCWTQPSNSKIGRIVPAPTWCPSPASSPWRRRWPQKRFSCARRSTRARISSVIGGRPDRLGQIQCLVIKRQCQASSVAGVPIRWGQSGRGSGRVRADRIAR